MVSWRGAMRCGFLSLSPVLGAGMLMRLEENFEAKQREPHRRHREPQRGAIGARQPSYITITWRRAIAAAAMPRHAESFEQPRCDR